MYLLAHEPLEPVRLQLQDADTGSVILLDIAAEPAQEHQPPLEPVRIIDVTSISTHSGATDAKANEATEPSRPTRETPLPVVLTRYAAQNLYAPLRTVEPVAGIGRVPLRRPLALDTLLPTLPLEARALAAWRLEDQWVTAVRLTNTSPHRIDLDPRALQGDFVAATFQHPDLGPAGASTDTTVVYLVTRGRGLAQSLMPMLSPIDAGTNLPPAAAAGRTSDEE
ncbi:integrating conjugative element protein [compost metagenome]